MPVPVSPDGLRYLAMARGETMPRPFLFRWLAPALLGSNPDARWSRAARFSFGACCVLGALYCWNVWALLVPFGLAGLTVQVRAPVLVDLHAMALALASAVLAMNGWWIPSIFVALIAGFTKETSPIFAAAWAWSPWPLLGLIGPICRAVVKPGDDVPQCRQGLAAEALTHPLRTALHVHRSQPFAWWVLPWGALIVGLASFDLQLAVVLLLAYGQCVVATDLVRLYQWAWPTLALASFDAVPRAWWPVLVVAHLASPHKGEGW